MEQRIKDAIFARAKEHTSRLMGDPGLQSTTDIINDVARALTEPSGLDDRLLARIKNHNIHHLSGFLNSVFNRYWSTDGQSLTWSLDSLIVKQLVHRKNLSQGDDSLSNVIRMFIMHLWHLWRDNEVNGKTIAAFLHQQQFSDKEIVAIVISSGDDVFFQNARRSEYDYVEGKADRQLTAFGEYVLPLLKASSGFLGFGKSSEIKSSIDHAVLGAGSSRMRTAWLSLLMKYSPENAPKDVSEFLVFSSYGSQKSVNIQCAVFLINEDAVKYEAVVIDALNKYQIDEGSKFGIYRLINRLQQGRHADVLRSIAEAHLAYFKADNQTGSYFHEPKVFSERLDEAYFDWLFDADPKQAIERVTQFFQESTFLNYRIFPYVVKKFPAEGLELLRTALKKDPGKLPQYVEVEYYKTIFELLLAFDLNLFKKDLLEFAVERAGKRSRELACELVSKLGDSIFQDAQSLLQGKTVDERVTGALILSLVPSTAAKTALNEGVDKETNDDTRDIILESLATERFGKPFTQAQVKDMIALAAKRKKLNKWNEKWIDESVLPGLKWNSGETLDPDAVRFLFYRMKRAPGLNSDIEARQVIQHIDKTSSGEFAKFLLKSFQDSNADVKIKYYLTLGALLGDNDMMSNLNALFTKSMTDKRMKMAEYVVGALAMVGTDKALRLVETIYRKYANKKPAVSLAARNALDAAASELNLSMDELTDRIIPNFDFDGIYKHITIDGEEYRAFVNDEFKINYFNEDNKIKKTLPASASKELKASFKDIEKEIGVVSKSQTVRLEKYMIEERRWASDDWTRFFFNNPIMSVFAMKLLWVVYDATGSLTKVFYCSQDASLYDVNDDEVSLDAGETVGILHPIFLSADQLDAWKQKLYDMSMTTIFPIVDRGVKTVVPAEAELNSSQVYAGKDIPKGADFVNAYLVKKNWIKSTGDGGRSDFSKLYKDGLIKAHAGIDGPAAWYQGGTAPAKMYDVSFWSKESRNTLKLKDLPPVFYSEVMSDIESMINAN